MAKQLIIVRGLPGSGKSTMVKNFTSVESQNRRSCTVHSTDDFHLELRDGIWEYVFKPEKLRYFHEQNLAHTDASMSLGVSTVIVDNTNTTWKEIKPYAEAAAKYGYEVVIFETTTDWAKNPAELAKRNTHNVPLEAIERMLNRWETTDSILNKLNQLVPNRNNTNED